MELSKLLSPNQFQHVALGTGSGSDVEVDEASRQDHRLANHGGLRLAVATSIVVTAVTFLLFGSKSGLRSGSTPGFQPLATDVDSVVSAAVVDIPVSQVATSAPAASPAVQQSSSDASAMATPPPWWTKLPSGSHLKVKAAVASAQQEPQAHQADWFDLLAGGDGAGTPLAPRASMHDGNVCGDDEELMQGLCYKQCSTLTFGEYPIRTSAWTCCKKRPCTLSNTKHNMGMCSGFDVAGDSQGDNACPHLPGSCLTNEELYMGMCYKKCSIMAPKFPTRAGVGTCCKTTGFWCSLPQYGSTSSEFAVGGGTGEDKTSPKKPHLPVSELTESS